jgi:hypothetical protein
MKTKDGVTKTKNMHEREGKEIIMFLYFASCHMR